MRITQLVVSSCLVLSCSGSIVGNGLSPATTDPDDPASVPRGPTTPSAPTPTTPGGPTTGGLPPTSPGQPGPSGVACAKASPAPPLRRLSAAEYRNTVSDVFPGLTLPELSLPADDDVAGFSAQTAALSDDTLPDYVDAAAAIAGAVGERGFLAGCDVARTGEEECVRQALERFGARAWRRPLTASERDELIAGVFRPARAAGLTVALEELVTRLLLAPEFLYHLEPGSPAPEVGPGVRRLTGAETASRLSYLLLRRPPDEMLARAAAAGELSDPAMRATHARRLLDDERALATVWDFHREWLHLDQFDEVMKDAKLFPTFDDNLRASMVEETRRFVAHAFRMEGGGVEALLLGRRTFVDARLTSLYGLPSGGSDWRGVDLPASGPRLGILGKAAFLAKHATTRESSVIFRGAAVRESLLCLHTPKPPADVETEPDVDRMRTQPCAACHTLIDPIGQALEGFDGIGRQRAQLDGRPVVTAGTLIGTPDVDGPVDGPGGLAGALARSNQTRTCLATQWLRFSLAREVGDGDACLLRSLTELQQQPRTGLREVILAHVASPEFVVRHEISDGGACR